MAQTVLGKPQGVDQTHTETHFQLCASGGLTDANYILVGLCRADFRFLQHKHARKHTHTQEEKKKEMGQEKRDLDQFPSCFVSCKNAAEGRHFERSVLVTLRAINVNKGHTARICRLTITLDRIEQASQEAFWKDKHVDSERINGTFFLPFSP